jgi:predicted nucleic acid-binding protein
MVLETAVNGRADGLVTFNEADFSVAARRFAFEVLRPSEALRRLREHPSE